ncbi:siphovirus ReqiPepy6 Gp37-like family protein [uncultured Methanobrevibacter sp.]|uniref:siphovirus ReqiPepy6 Gp37-like family protein n=1 Tax=uncultured Methanobrevibacter sp. TaxID=253161 RepID=UPI00262CA42C|nr:siphovirus ReqiPepy6 Gp37-like family protein [uncultured Methanobrevibacter sp.]
MMIPVIMNRSFERLAEIDDYISFIWTNRYYEAGDFELVVVANAENIATMQKWNYIVRDDDENIGIIEKLSIVHEDEIGNVLTVSGRFLASILGRRIIATQTTVTGGVSNCINKLINENVINPSVAARKISNFILGTYSFSNLMQAQYTGDNLLETISMICQTYGLGFKVTLNDQHKFVFQLYKGVDHTYDQHTNPYVVFSDEFDNLISSEYEENCEEMTTAVLVAGEGEGLQRKTMWITNNATGLDRCELYKDQRDLQSNNGEISDAEYNKLLEEAGRELLTTYTAAFTGEVYMDNVNYKTDLNVGDLVVIENKKWGIYMNTRLVEVIESVSETGEYTTVPTFGV